MNAGKVSTGASKSPGMILGVIACFDLWPTCSGPACIPAIVSLVALEMLIPKARLH